MKKSELEYVNETQEVMKKEVSDEVPEMLSQMRNVDGRLGYMYCLLAFAEGELDRQSDAAAEVLKAQSLAAFVLKTKVEAMVSGYREDRDRIQGLIKAMETRIMMCQSILRWKKSLPME